MYPKESVNDYIKSILGYPNNNNLYINENKIDYLDSKEEKNQELENYYPEIYKKIYPMILKKCKNLTVHITEDLINKITDEIYNTVGTNNEISLNINIQNSSINNINENRKSIRNRNSMESYIENRKISRQPVRKEIERDEKANRNVINSTLKDLIKILVIRELLERPKENIANHLYSEELNNMPFSSNFETFPYFENSIF